jgi:hypothetical protein
LKVSHNISFSIFCPFPFSCSAVKKINFPHSGDLETDSEFSVCFERGGKIAASGDRPLYRTLDGSMEVMVNESLSLVVTMYLDQQSHQYQVSDPTKSSS